MIALLLVACVGRVEPATETCDACGGACLQEAIPAESAAHVEGEVAYADYPPTSGDHDPCWAAWGVHTDVVRAENWVHNLEHGGVVVLYDAAAADPADVEAATTFVAGLEEGRALLTAAEEPLGEGWVWAAIAWQYRVRLGCWDEAAVLDFFGAHVGRAPEDVTSMPLAECGDTGDTAGG